MVRDVKPHHYSPVPGKGRNVLPAEFGVVWVCASIPQRMQHFLTNEPYPNGFSFSTDPFHDVLFPVLSCTGQVLCPVDPLDSFISLLSRIAVHS